MEGRGVGGERRDGGRLGEPLLPGRVYQPRAFPRERDAHGLPVEGHGELLRRGRGRRDQRRRGVVLPGAEGRGQRDRGARRLLARREGRMSRRLAGESKAGKSGGLTTAALKLFAPSLFALCLAWGASFAQTPTSAPPAQPQSAPVAQTQSAPVARPQEDPARWRAALEQVSA